MIWLLLPFPKKAKAKRGVGVSYTLETPSSLDLMRRVRCHQLAVSAAVRGFLLTR